MLVSSGSNNSAETDFTMWKRGHYRRSDTMSGPACHMAVPGSDPTYLFSHGNYDHQMNTGILADAEPPFGFDLGGEYGNTFFPPVESIQIGIYHPFGAAENGGNHDIYSYGLDVRVHLWSIEKEDPHPDLAFYRSRVNILWQPFGENAAFVDP